MRIIGGRMLEPAIKLTRDERRAIFAGDYRALKRKSRPTVKAGNKLVLSWTRRSRHVADRATGTVVEIPRKPAVWIEFREPEVKDGIWLIRFSAHDGRQPLRLLGGTPSPRADNDEAGWTPDTERGYVGSARAAIDLVEAEDDETLRGRAAEARCDRAEFRRELEEQNADLAAEARRKRERAIRDRLSVTLKGLRPEAQLALMAAVEQALQRADMEAKGHAA